MNRSYKIALAVVLVVCALIVGISLKQSDPSSDRPDLHAIAGFQPSDSEPSTMGATWPDESNKSLTALIEPPETSDGRVRPDATGPTPDATGPTPDAKLAKSKIATKHSEQLSPEPVRTRTFGDGPPSLSNFTLTDLTLRQETVASDLRSEAESTLADSNPHAREPGAGVDTTKQHTIKAGDTFSRLAVRHFGHDRFWPAIAAANPTVDPRILQVGQVIQLPPPSQVHRDRPKAAIGDTDRNTHRVRPGDTLWALALQYYKDAHKWRVILNANRQTLGSQPDQIEVGQNLIIPPQSEPAARDNSSTRS